MELENGFIDRGIAFLETHPEYAGVAGTVEIDDAANYEFTSRKQRIHKVYPLDDCDHLGSGGLYRRSAIESIGYLTNRNLHSYEEAELGIRLHDAGYKLHRLDVPYFRHTFHTMPTIKMMQYRWKHGFLWASGELLRCSWGKHYFRKALRIVKNEAMFTVYLLTLLIAILSFNVCVISVALSPLLAFMAIKKIKNRFLISGLQSVMNLAVFSAGLIKGLTRPVRDPVVPPDSKIIHE